MDKRKPNIEELVQAKQMHPSHLNLNLNLMNKISNFLDQLLFVDKCYITSSLYD